MALHWMGIPLRSILASGACDSLRSVPLRFTALRELLKRAVENITAKSTPKNNAFVTAEALILVGSGSYGYLIKI